MVTRKVKPKTELQQHIDELIAKHGGLRAAARATGIDVGYLWRIRVGEKRNPQEKTLKKLGLERSVLYRPSGG